MPPRPTLRERIDAAVPPASPAARGSFFWRSMRASTLLGLLATAFAVIYAGWSLALVYFTTLAWALANLLIWAAGLKEILGRKRPWIVLPLAALKLAWLVLLIVLAAHVNVRNFPNLTALLLGFNTPFIVMVLKALGLWLTTRINAGTPYDRA